MNRGRKADTPATKALRGTTRRDRKTADVVELSVVERAQPVPPAWMTKAGKAVWAADLPRALATGLDAIDTHVFALYCETMATFVEATEAGTPPNASFRAELRRMMEALGIGGAKSRLVKIGAPEKDKTAPFSVRRD